MLKIYGSMLCKDCVQCCSDLDQSGTDYAFLDFSEDLQNLKEFLGLRDALPIFAEVRKQGKIGIPCIVDEAGKVSLSWDFYVSQDNA